MLRPVQLDRHTGIRCISKDLEARTNEQADGSLLLLFFLLFSPFFAASLVQQLKRYYKLYSVFQASRVLLRKRNSLCGRQAVTPMQFYTPQLDQQRIVPRALCRSDPIPYITFVI